MNNKRLFLDIYAIQTLPPSNINRDDTGSPKTAQYGGVKRARVSSQSWKKAMRDYFYNNSEQENMGVRTKDILEYISDKIQKLDPTSTDSNKLAESLLKDLGIGLKDGKAKALFFLGDKQAENLAKAAVHGNYDKNKLKKIIRDNPAIDIALFGRMVADDPSLNEDASSQVAHSISTHAIDTEFDFFTAVDDLMPEENAGAGMLGTVEFNSSTLYRYANVAVHELNKQLGNDKQLVIDTLNLFIKSFSISLPTGKVNTFANQTLPQFIMVALRDDRPVNLVSAFEDPIKSTNGFVDKSIDKLLKETTKVEKFVNEPLATFVLNTNEKTEYGRELIVENSLSELLKDLDIKLSEEI